MNKRDMFMAMTLTHARRAEARGVVLAVENGEAKLDLLMWDGSCKPLAAPPPDVMAEIIAALEAGQTDFTASVHTVVVERRDIKRTSTGVVARIFAWSVEQL